jgi:DNA-binding CsgD family transcriptional regulator
MRTKTIKLDREILFKLSKGITPKSLAYEMGISVYYVYNAIRRNKQFTKNNHCKTKTM